MTDKKKKKGVAVIISIGPKMKTKPTDAATPDMKKYGSMPMKKTWQTLKALPEHQMFLPPYEKRNLAEYTWDYTDAGVDVGDRQRGAGTIHPAIYGMMQRRMKENPELTSGSYNKYGSDLPNLNIDTYRQGRDSDRSLMLEGHPERYAELPYAESSIGFDIIDPHATDHEQWPFFDSIEEANKDWFGNNRGGDTNDRRTQAPQTFSYKKTHPTNKEVRQAHYKRLHGEPMEKAFGILKNLNIADELRNDIANAPDNYALDEIMDNRDEYDNREAQEKYRQFKRRRKTPQRMPQYALAPYPQDEPEQPKMDGPYDSIFESIPANQGTSTYPPKDVFGKAFQMLKQNFRISNLPEHVRERNLPDMSPQRFIGEDLHRKGAKNYTRDFMPGPSRYDDEGFPEYDGEDLGPPYGKPEFGDEDARQAEMNEAERAAIMAEGMPEMRKPRSAPRPGDPRFADPNKPRLRVPKDIFANR